MTTPTKRRPRKQREEPRFTRTYARDAIARALLDADAFGDKVTAERLGVHRNTIANWRRASAEDSTISDEMARLRKEVRDGWIEEARDVRRKALARVGELLGDARNLTSAVNALRRVHEVILSDEILNDDPSAAADALDDQRPDPDQQAHPSEAQGSRGGEGDDGPGDLGGGEG